MAVVATLSKGYDLDYIWKQVDRGPAKDAASYYIQASETGGEPPGRWWGPGAKALGFELGQTVERQPYDLLFGQRKAPDGTRLGKPPDGGRKAADVYTRLLAAEPHATAERRHELRIEATGQTRQSPLFFDLTLSLSKSISIFHASLGENARLNRMYKCPFSMPIRCGAAGNDVRKRGQAKLDRLACRRRAAWIWASLSSVPARLTLSPSISPGQPSRSASAMRSCRLSRISSSRPRWAGSGLRSEHLTQACSWTQGEANARAQVPTDTFRFSKFLCTLSSWVCRTSPARAGDLMVTLRRARLACRGRWGRCGPAAWSGLVSGGGRRG